MNITVVLITRNEELHLERAVRSVRHLDFAERVVVVDSGSSDSTVDIARRLCCDTLYHEFTSHAAQFQWALDNANIDSEWVMRLDADEYLPSATVEKIAEVLSSDSSSGVNGYMLPRYHVFMGKRILHGGRYPMYLTRLWRAGFASVEQRLMDEHIAVSGRVEKIDAAFADHNLRGLSYFIGKHNSYASLEARQTVQMELLAVNDVSGARIPRQARAKRVIRRVLYERLPLGLRALLYFVWRYLLRFGFLDGARGSVYHVLQGFWYRYLVDAKVLELKDQLRRVEPGSWKEIIDSYA